MPGTQPERDHLELAAERLVRLPRRVDLRHHRRRSRPRRASARATRPRPRSPPAPSESRAGRRDRADPRDVRAHLHAELAQEGLGERAGRHARGGLARRGALEHVAHVRVPELLDAGEVGVARARQVHLVHLGVHRPGVHPLLPVLVVAVLDPHRHRAAERAPVADARGDLARGPSRSSCARRGRGRAGAGRGRASMSSGRSSRPAGRPSTIAVSPGPWDSPAVTKRKDMAPTPYKRGCGRQVGGGTAGRGLLRRACASGSVRELVSGRRG